MRQLTIMTIKLFLLLLWSLFLCGSISICYANKQGEYLSNFLHNKKQSSYNNRQVSSRVLDYGDFDFSELYVDEKQSGMKEADKVKSLPGQPRGADFDQYAGYVTVDAKAGRALFYYFVESPQNASSKPLVLWLNGGPGCSSLGYGAMEELGPFRVNSDGKTLCINEFAWNNVANVIFLESPAGVGFSYSNTSLDYSKIGDKSTSIDSYNFLLNWLERFPQYKNRDFFITGESYAGHYIPQLAETILSNNNNNSTRNHTVINLKGIAIGNGWIDDNMCTKGMYEYFWTHALNSDETHEGIQRNCDFENSISNFTYECEKYQSEGDGEIGDINIYNIYASPCNSPTTKTSVTPATTCSVNNFDPCSDDYTESYLNLPEVQEALHAKASKWSSCSVVGWTDSPDSVLPIINRLISSGISIWIYSGDTDGRVPITSSRYAINTLKLPLEKAWHPWYSDNEIGGYVTGYKGVTLITVRGAGHMVPSYQPKRALSMISFFLRGQFPS